MGKGAELLQSHNMRRCHLHVGATEAPVSPFHTGESHGPGEESHKNPTEPWSEEKPQELTVEHDSVL